VVKQVIGDLDCIVGKKKVVFSNGQILDREEFDSRSLDGTVESGLKLAEEDPERNGWDYQYALETGDLLKLQEPVDLVSLLAPKPADPEKQKKFSSAFLVEAAMLFAGVGGGVMSAYHTAVFLIGSGKPAWIGWTTGASMILFSTTAFTLARIVANKLSPLIVAFGLSVMAFSMFSTVAVNFDQFKRREEAVAKDNEAQKRLIEINLAELEENAAEIYRLEQEAGYWRDRSWARRDDSEASLAAARSRRRELLDLQRDLALPEPVDTVYALIGRLFKTKEDTARFMAYAAPSLFYDLAAPLALSVALFLGDRRRKREEIA
jgi:hypothetical protein